MISIREEALGDVAAVRRVNELAFGQPAEAGIVDALRENCEEILSLVAVEDEKIIGHILFSPVTIERDGKHEGGSFRGSGLAPMAVLPDRQRQGIGSRLVEAGIARLRQRSCPFIIVLGHAEYYPRFGFVPASKHGIRCPWEGVPDEAFMILVLDEGAMESITGIARYRAEFDEAM